MQFSLQDVTALHAVKAYTLTHVPIALGFDIF